MKATWNIGKIFGIEINIDASWLIIFVLVTWTLAGSQFPTQYPGWSSLLYWIVGIATSILFFASILGHELAHSLIAIQRGEKVRSITLFIFGGVAQITEEPERPLTELLMALAGPLSSLVIAAAFWILWLLTRGVVQPVAAMGRYLAIINASLALFNLIPGFPLDGGRVLRAVIWGLSGDLKAATRAASWLGQGIAFLFMLWGISQIFFGLWLNGLWMAFIGWFLHNAAVSGYRQLMMRDMLRDVQAEDLMSSEFETVTSDLTLQQLVDDYVLRHRYHSYPVADEGRLQGIICLHDVRAVPRERWGATRVNEVMTPQEQVLTVSAKDNANTVLERLNAKDVHQLPVIEDNLVIDILRRSDIIRYLQLRSELGI